MQEPTQQQATGSISDAELFKVGRRLEYFPQRKEKKLLYVFAHTAVPCELLEPVRMLTYG